MKSIELRLKTETLSEYLSRPDGRPALMFLPRVGVPLTVAEGAAAQSHHRCQQSMQWPPLWHQDVYVVCPTDFQLVHPLHRPKQCPLPECSGTVVICLMVYC